MNLQWLYYFDTIAELEHYTKAADKLHVSQSNLSHAIKELETEIGAELFERRGRNIKLSKYGELFHPYVKQTLNSLETGISTLKEYIDPDIGTIVLSGFQSLAPFSTDLMVRYQSETNRMEIQFHYSSETMVDLAEKLKNGETDLVLSTKLSGDWVGSHYIGDHRLVALVPKTHPFAEKRFVRLSDFENENVIMFDKKSVIRQDLERHFQENHVKTNIIAETPNDQVVYGLVAAGRGIAVVPQPLNGAPYNTVTVPLGDGIVKRELYLQWNKNRYISTAAKYFRDYVIQCGTVFDQYWNYHELSS